MQTRSRTPSVILFAMEPPSISLFELDGRNFSVRALNFQHFSQHICLPLINLEDSEDVWGAMPHS